MRYTLYILFLLLHPLLPQSPVINEVMAVNLSTLEDEDGEFEDWIELYNPSSSPISLAGYGLSDNRDEPLLWELPSASLPANGYFLLFASGKDRRSAAAHWETIIDWGDTWKYRIGDSEPPSDWQLSGFDDSGWLEGPTGIGYGDDDDATIIAPTLSFYMRYTFTIDDIDAVRSVLFHVDYDDAYVAYLNGEEFSRANIGVAGGAPPAFDDIPDMYTEPQIANGGLPFTIPIDDYPALLSDGENVLAIQVHNYLLTSSDMSIIPFFTLGYDASPPNATGLSTDLTTLVPNIHTNFSLASAGETIFLADSAGTIVDSLAFQQQTADISYGRQPDGSSTLAFFSPPTPGDSNSASGFNSLASAPEFSETGGFYSSTISVELSSPEPNATIYYTLDATEPTTADLLYSTPIEITTTSVLRARAFIDQSLPSAIQTHTYFMNESSDLVTISLVTDPGNFFDEDSGIYVRGPNASNSFPYFGANFWEDWERPVHLELFAENSSREVSMNAGVKIFGGWSRGNAQKSLSLFARGEYGSREIAYQLFPDRDFDSYQSFNLRNSGNDWNESMFRDGLMQTLTKNTAIDRQAYRTAVVFLNGEYWGIHNIREKLNEHYLAANHNVPTDGIDMLELDRNVIHGSADHYNNMMDYITANDLADPLHFGYITTQLDLNNYLDYQVAQIYFNNTDWPGNNIKFWRPQTETGKWRWILFDTDFGFSLWTSNAFLNNTLQFAAAANGPAWPNPPWSTLLFREMLKNEAFEISLINRFADRINADFHRDRIITVIDSIHALLDDNIERHMNRWGGISTSEWEDRVQIMRDYATLRPSRMRQHIVSYFNLDGQAFLTLDVSQDGGSIKLNVLHHRQFPWTGVYFQGVPVSLTAIPDPGYHFIRWEGGLSGSDPAQTVLLDGNAGITAVFEKAPNSGQVVINEINYNSTAAFNPEDWIELLNDTGAPVNVGNWQFKDEDDAHVFTVPSGMVIDTDGFLVLCRDSLLFSAAFPEVTNYVGNVEFGLAGAGELLRLYDAQGTLVDSLTYDDEAPWPLEPDGDGPTLALTDATLDNALGGSWATSIGFGTPGSSNLLAVGINNDAANESLPQAFRLYQNMPNPFNPATTIQFDLPQTSKVLMEVYTILGQRVATLVDANINAGSHSVTWTPEQHVTSGIYIYRLQTEKGFTESQKLIYLR